MIVSALEEKACNNDYQKIVQWNTSAPSSSSYFTEISHEIGKSSTILCSRFCDEMIKASHADFGYVVEENNGGWKHRLNLLSQFLISEILLYVMK